VDSIEAIQADYLRGQELQLNAFNRLLAWRAPVIPVAMQVRVERVEDIPTGLGAVHKGA
jgi:hypothetical protein